MKKLAFLLLSVTILGTPVHAQNFDNRFGKVSEEELRMEVYDKDPEAAAVVLYENSALYYQLTTPITRTTDYRVRIKILKQEGTDYASVVIPYIDTQNLKELVSAIDAVAYNLVDGKIVKTPLKKQYIFNEQVDETNRLFKLSIPDVKAGTVIEYRYRIQSPNFSNIPSFRIQRDIPVILTEMSASLPEYFRFRISQKGYLPIEITRSSSTGMISQTDINYSNDEIKATGRDIPALKKDSHVWCLNDFRSMVDFELSAISIPGSLLQTFSGSWEEVNNALGKTSFDSNTKIGNPFKQEVAQIKAQNLPPRQTAHAVLKLIQSKIKWNEEYRLFSSGPRAAANKGVGSSCEINFLLMAALKDAGISVSPILLSPRHMGRLPYTHASMDAINTFLVRMNFEDGTVGFADGTDPNSDIDLLPTELLVDRARVYGVHGDAGWCDLTHISPGVVMANIIMSLQEDGTLTGQVIEQYIRQSALHASTEYTQAQSQDEYIADIEKEQNIQVENFTIEGVGTPQVTRKYKMIFTPGGTDQYAYINATVLPFMSQNEFSAETRILPVEFASPISYNIRGTISLPAGYEVEELPKNSSMAACENGLRCRYLAQTAGNTIQFNFQFTTDRLIYPSQEYGDLRMFHGMIADLSNSQIVIRKTAAQ